MLTGSWIEIKDGDDRARALYLKHYSARHYRDGRRRSLFIGPGEKFAFMTLSCQSLWVWRKFKDDAIPLQTGVNNADFIHHGPEQASELIKEACELAWQRWPNERLYTYVDSRKIKSSHPGYCYLQAGWDYQRDERGKPVLTKGGLHILEIMPESINRTSLIGILESGR